MKPLIASPWSARFDLLQSLSGLFLALFMWLHMAFVSSILWGEKAFWTVARFFEGYFFFGRSLPWLVSLFVACIAALIAVHALLALRKFPASWQQYRAFWEHRQRLAHLDTNLWPLQVATGFLMFFLASVHLYDLFIAPEQIGPYGSADLVWTGRTWPLLLLLLFCVEVHGLIGLYRLALKWGWPSFGDPQRTRRILRRLLWVLLVFFLAMGLLTLGTFISLGIEHAPRAGEPYVPSGMQEAL